MQSADSSRPPGTSSVIIRCANLQQRDTKCTTSSNFYRHFISNQSRVGPFVYISYFTNFVLKSQGYNTLQTPLLIFCIFFTVPSENNDKKTKNKLT